MKKIIISFSLFLLFSINLIAQQNHFIYIQADNKQPFYVKLNDKVYSSSATGYIILSKLVENNYNLTIGFPKNEWTEQKLNLTVQKNDLGYLLKNFEEKGWGLVDMNTFQILYTNNQPITSKPSNAVAKAADVNGKIIEVKKEEPKSVEITSSEKNISKMEGVNGNPAEVKKEQPTQIEKVETKAAVRKLFTSKSNNSIEIVYVVNNNTAFDTVRISIGSDGNKTQVASEAQPIKTIETKNNSELIYTPIRTEAKPEEKSDKEQPKQAVNTNVPKEIIVVKNVPKNNCISVANEEDYKKLRKKMASVESDNEMIYKATAVFKKQCYTTEQIKTLSFLFLNEDGKYKFFDTAYPYVSDAENFPKLVSLLSDDYYIKRFNAMLKN